MCSKVEDFNSKVRSNPDLQGTFCVGSLDLTGLFPSVNIKKAGAVCRDTCYESKVDVEWVDWGWALAFLATTMTPEQKVDGKVTGLDTQESGGQREASLYSLNLTR